jgi:heat-inducible transcriptional repressor
MTEKDNLKLSNLDLLKKNKSKIFELDKRSKQIFKLIVDDFLNEGKPVGSRRLSIKMGEQLSPASVRNVMFDLQEAGLLKSSHSSAGRVPTDLGLRFFVDGLLQVGKIGKNQSKEIQRTIDHSSANVEQICSDAGTLLSGLLDCAGIVLAPKLNGFLKHIEFVPMSKDKALVILITDDGIIENRIISLPKGLPNSTLIETTNYLNSIIKGRTLLESKKIINEEIKNDKVRIDNLVQKLIDDGIACWNDASRKNKLIVTGTAKLFDDIKAIEQLEDTRVLIEKLENKKNLMGIIDETQQADGLQIFIGSENNLFGLTDCTTIISPFRNKEKEIIGAIGVIGPMRLNYAKIIPVVDYTANLIGKKFQIT